MTEDRPADVGRFFWQVYLTVHVFEVACTNTIWICGNNYDKTDSQKVWFVI